MTSKAHILLVEDEQSLQKLVAMNLELENYKVTTASTGFEAEKIFKNQSFKLVILDIMLPEVNGLELAQSFKVAQPNTPILFLSAKSDTQDRIAGLKLGDDYLTKPFDLEELLLRIENLLKFTLPKQQEESDSFNIGHFNIFLNSHQLVDEKGKKTDLSKNEVIILRLLYENRGKVLSRQEILDQVWGHQNSGNQRMVDNYMTQLRKRVELDSKQPKHIVSIRGLGYKLVL